MICIKCPVSDLEKINRLLIQAGLCRGIVDIAKHYIKGKDIRFEKLNGLPRSVWQSVRKRLGIFARWFWHWKDFTQALEASLSNSYTSLDPSFQRRKVHLKMEDTGKISMRHLSFLNKPLTHDKPGEIQGNRQPQNVRDTQIEKDYIITSKANGLSQNEYFERGALIQGRHCLKKAYYPDYRFSRPGLHFCWKYIWQRRNPKCIWRKPSNGSTTNPG